MRALRFHGPGDLRLENVERPEPGPGEVLIAVEAAGVCGSDLHILDGSTRTGKVPITLGHEIAGRVAATGSDRWASGDEVVVAGLPGCGACRHCGTGRPNLCPRAALPGIHVDGGWADFVLTRTGALVSRPPGLAPEVAAVAPDAGATAYHAVVRRGAVAAGDAVAIIGIGGLGAFALQFAKHAGAAPIIAVDTDEAALSRARGLGADEVVLVAPGRSVGREVRLLTDGGADVAVEFVGASGTIDAALKSLRPGGRAVAAGVGDEPLATLPSVLWATMEYELRGAYGSLPGDTERVLGWLADGTLQPPPTLDVALDDGAAAIRAAAAGDRPAGRLMVRP